MTLRQTFGQFFRLAIVMLAIVAGGFTSAKAAPGGDDIADVSYFYDELREGGDWISHPRYGDVWRPNVSDGWRPYTIGNWLYSDDYGWTWMSAESFGWAVYHYGRWTFDRREGWLWLPGTEWAPAWVVWRYGEDVIGWAPLPATVRFDGGRVFADPDSYNGPRYERRWVFVRADYFGRADMNRYIRPTSWNSDLMARSTARISYERIEDRIVNRGLPIAEIERLTRREVRRVRVSPVDDLSVLRGLPRAVGKIPDDFRTYRPNRDRTEQIVKSNPRPPSPRADRLSRQPRPDDFDDSFEPPFAATQRPAEFMDRPRERPRTGNPAARADRDADPVPAPPSTAPKPRSPNPESPNPQSPRSATAPAATGADSMDEGVGPEFGAQPQGIGPIEPDLYDAPAPARSSRGGEPGQDGSASDYADPPAAPKPRPPLSNGPPSKTGALPRPAAPAPASEPVSPGIVGTTPAKEAPAKEPLAKPSDSRAAIKPAGSEPKTDGSKTEGTGKKSRPSTDSATPKPSGSATVRTGSSDQKTPVGKTLPDKSANTADRPVQSKTSSDAPVGKRQWDGSGPSGAPATAKPSDNAADDN